MARELWQMAGRWLAQIGTLSADNPALSANARVYDLALALQDGSVLCHTANKLSANCIETVHNRPEKQFMRMQNINNFLTVCSTVFGLKAGDLFTADELYYASNFAKVVETLSLLSKSQLAGLAGYKYFPQSNEKAENRAEENGEDMYSTLEDLVGQSLSLEEAAKDLPILDEDSADQHADKIYGAIQTVVEEGGDEVYQDLLYSAQIYSTSGSTQDEKRNCVLGELHETERNYVKVLDTVVTVFRSVMSSQPKIITKSDVQTVFSNIEEVLHAHQRFLERLDTSLSSTTGRMIAPCFLDCIPTFKCYGQFCCEIPDAIAKIRELSAKPAAQKLMDQAKKESGQRFALKDLLNVPMQRVLKYPLLLKELHKYTPQSHPDKTDLATALTSVEDLAKYINERKKDYDNLKNMMGAIKQYTGKPVLEFGSLVKDGDLVYKCETSKDKMKIRYVFLCSTAIIICKSRNGSYVYKKTIDLTECDYELNAHVQVWTYPKEEQKQFDKFSFAWTLKGKKGSTVHSHVFATKNNVGRKKWVSLLTNLLQAIKDSKTGPPELAPRASTRQLGNLPPAAAASPADPPSPRMARAKDPLPPAPLPEDKKKGKPKKSYEEWSVAPPPPPGGEAADRPDAKESGDDAWFAGKLPRAKAEKLLEGCPDGTFLVRESDSRPGDYSLSIKYKIVKHIKINRTGKNYELAPDAKHFPTIQELVEHFQRHSLNRHFPGMETTLEIPFRDAPGYAAMPKPGGPAITRIGRARARFPYEAKNPDELSFERGVELDIISTHDQDPGWWKGALPSGQVGIFPANYVQQL
eukprot:m.12643 g.12643  ORF g.12643 m.12643 type:complete len:807 (+) comp6968_c0_seq1:124-2544(+)